MGAILRSGRDPGSEVKVMLFRRFVVKNEFEANGTSCQMECCVIIAGVHLRWDGGRGKKGGGK